MTPFVILPKKRKVIPRFRINKSRNSYYVQVKGIQGDERWYSLGRLNPETLDIARRLVINDWKERTNEEVRKIEEKYGIKAYTPPFSGPEDIDLFYYLGDIDVEMRYNRIKRNALRREKEREKRLRRRLARKLKIPRITMKREEFDSLMQRDPDSLTKEERERREEIRKAYEEGRIILE